MNGNALIVHGGAPTAVINASLYGAVKEAKNMTVLIRSMPPSAAAAQSSGSSFWT